MTSPFVIREPSFAEQIQPGVQTLMQALAARSQQRLAQQELNIAKDRVKIAKDQLDISRGQLQRQKKQDAANLFTTALKFEPNLLDTESGKQIAEDAGLDPLELLKQQELRKQRREEWLATRPESHREALRALVDMSDVVDAPAAVREHVYNSFLPPEIDSKTFTIFLGLWRTGVITAGQASEASGFPLPEGFPLHEKVPRGSGSSGTPEQDRQLQRLSRELGALNTLIDNARPVIDRERKRIEKEAGFVDRGGQLMYTGPGTEAAGRLVVSSRMNAFIKSNFPEFTQWQERATETQRRMAILVDASFFGQEDVTLSGDAVAELGQELIRGRR
jgi:hypothetical protein